MNTAWTTTLPPILLAVCALTHVTALATAIIGQPCTSSIVATDHASVVVDDSIQVIARQLLLFLTNTELAQVQVPNRKLHQVIDLVSPNETTKGEALELHDEHVR